MVDAVSSNLPPSVQAVNKARNTVDAQRKQGAVLPSDEVSLSAEAQEISAANSQAQQVREELAQNQSQTLTKGRQLDEIL